MHSASLTLAHNALDSPIIIVIIGASLSEPHIDRTSGRFPYTLWYDSHPRAALGRTKITREVDRKSPTYVHMLASANFTVSSCCIFRQSATVAVSFDIGSLQYGFYKSSTRLRYKSATRLRSANPGITDALLQRRRERERDRRDSETAVQREDRLSKRRIRDRARRVAHTVERRQSLLQQRRDRLATE